MLPTIVLASLAGLLALCLPRLLSHPPTPHLAPMPPEPDEHPESMTAELAAEDEEYLAWLADHLWPDDEYLDMEPDAEGEGGGTVPR